MMQQVITIIMRLDESLKCSAARACASKGQDGGWRETGVIDNFAEDVDSVGQSATGGVE